MPNKKATINRTTVLERVTTPLGFFTLGILVIEAILASLSLRATGTNLTVLILGMLIGFLLLCSMVFVLTVHPRLRQALLGSVDYSAARAIQEMHLSSNDIRIIYTFSVFNEDLTRTMKMHARGEHPMPPKDRIDRFLKLGLIVKTKHSSEFPAYVLGHEGRDIVDLIRLFTRPFIDLGDPNPITPPPYMLEEK